jgi:hypothetical protein
MAVRNLYKNVVISFPNLSKSDIYSYLKLVENSAFELKAVSYLCTTLSHRIHQNEFATSFTEARFLAIKYNGQRYFPTEIGKFYKLQKNNYICSPAIIHNMETNSN